MKTRFLVVGIWLLVLVGCAANPKQSFNKQANPHIENIGVIQAKNPESINVRILHHPGANFGLIGGLIAEGDMKSKSDRYNEAVASKAPDWANYISEKLQLRLQEAGFTTQVIPTDRESNGYLDKYPASNVDAFLDYFFMVDYLASTPSSDYMPSVRLHARLVDRKSEAILYEERIAFGYPFTFGDPIHIPSSDYKYPDIDSLVNAADNSLAGLIEGADKVVEVIGKQLNPQQKISSVIK